MRVFAILALVGAANASPALAHEDGMMGQGGVTGQRDTVNLKQLPPEQAVRSARYCKGQYVLTTAAGDIVEFPEFNLRIKTDISDKGPARGAPALLPAGMQMMGDRAFLIFSEPDEISAFVETDCEAS